MKEITEALDDLDRLVTPYDGNDELGLQIYGYFLHEHKDLIRTALQRAEKVDGLVKALEKLSYAENNMWVAEVRQLSRLALQQWKETR